MLTQQAQKSTASPCVSYYHSPSYTQSDQLLPEESMKQRHQCSDELLHIVKNDRLLFHKLITSLVATIGATWHNTKHMENDHVHVL